MTGLEAQSSNLLLPAVGTHEALFNISVDIVQFATIWHWQYKGQQKRQIFQKGILQAKTNYNWSSKTFDRV